MFPYANGLLPLKDPIPMFLLKHGSKHLFLLKTDISLFPFHVPLCCPLFPCMVLNCKSYDLLKVLFDVHF